MGISHLSDAVTGLALAKGGPVVAVVIARRKGGYPDAQNAAAIPGIYPNHLFTPVSLPFQAYAGEYGDIVPSKGQIAVDVLCRMTETKDWGEFSKAAFDFNRGISIGRELTYDGHRWRREWREPEVLGVSVVTASTWQALLDAYPRRNERTGDVALVKSAMLDAADRIGNGSAFGEAGRMLRLCLNGRFTFSGTTEAIEMPPLAFSLTDMDGPNSLDGSVVSHLQFASGLLSEDSIGRAGNQVEHERLEGLLGALWDHQAFHWGLSLHNRYLLPSPSAGQHGNEVETARLATETISQAFRTGLDRAVEWDSEATMEEMVELAEEVEALGRRIRSLLEEKRPGFNRD